MKISFSAYTLPKEGALVLGVTEGKKLLPTTKAIDKTTKSGLSKAIKASRFEGKMGDVLEILAPQGLSTSRVLLVGLGKAKDLKATKLERLGAALYRTTSHKGDKKVTIAIDFLKESKMSEGEFMSALAAGVVTKSYRFDKYRTTEKADKKPTLKEAVIATADSKAAKKEFITATAIIDAANYTKDLVSEPSNILNPETYAARLKKLKDIGLKVEVLGEKKMAELGMGALLGVGQGSEIESQMVILSWEGAAKKEAPVAFVGKGVTFDTGGISIKPALNMEDMKWDMGGSATVVGTMIALAKRKAKVNAVGVVGLVENMPSGNAQRPGDVVTSMSGQTIEVLNTDAEGRLVLADALHYCESKYKPQVIVDLATLTGAIIMALGSEYAGLFSNSDKLSKQLTDAGESVGEKLWRFPLHDNYDKLIDCDIADMKNIGSGGAGSITAAQFLQRFVKKTDWAHLDIAGTTWSKKEAGLHGKGATSYGVRMLNKFVADNYEG